MSWQHAILLVWLGTEALWIIICTGAGYSPYNLNFTQRQMCNLLTIITWITLLFWGMPNA